MSILKKRWFALFLCILVVAASTLINTRVKFGALVDDVIDSFYYGTVSDESIYDHLKTISTEAQKLVLLGKEYGIDRSVTEDVEDSVAWLQENVEYTRGYENLIYENYQDIQSSLLNLENALNHSSLSAEDTALLASCDLTIANAKAAIDASDYNSIVRSFLKAYNHFPTSNLAHAAGISMPKLFERLSY